MENPIVIFGAKTLGISALEIFKSNDVLVYGFLDDDTKLHGKELEEITILGATDDDGFLKLIGKKCDAFLAIENNKQRQILVEMLIDKRKVMPVNAIHARAYISNYASIGHGNLIHVNTYIGVHSKLGSHCIIHPNVSIDTDVNIADFVTIGAGTVINSSAIIEEGAFVGSGVTVISGVTIGKNARIGAGSVVMSNIKANQTVFGVPAVEVKN
jgi:sugar O-acyltransferase (sialic acid O-acetyltransferase NeuD family)